MFNYSMMPLDTEHFDEIVADIRNQYKRGISTCPMFIMTLVPEGDPVWDKVEPMCERFRKFRLALAPEGIPVGILIQASLGHGYNIIDAPFTRQVGVNDGTVYHAYCPFDKDFTEHFKKIIRSLVKEKPAAIMLDDDFRLVQRPSQGCACELHLHALKKKTGKSFTRESLWKHIMSAPDGDETTLAFLDTQTDALVHAANEFRKAIDEIDPSLQVINCTSGDLCESVIYTSRILCGNGNPRIVRVPNGTYAPVSTKEFSDTMRRAAVCSSKLKKHGVDHILAETDTIPFNRYGKNARYLHAHYTASVLDGLEGAKHWITRTRSFEPKSGEAFRDILAEHSRLYERLAELSREIKWVGANSVFTEQKYYCYHLKDHWQYHPNTWATKVFERMGLPFYFSENSGKINFLEERIARDMPDEQIKAMFENSVFMTSEVANDLADRGYGDLLGVTVSEWEGGNISGEVFSESSLTVNTQKNSKKLIPDNSKTEELSHAYRNVSGSEREILFPAVTLLDRGDGRLSVVYSGTPDAEHNYIDGFAFLTETRREQFIELFKRAGELPVYCDSDAELCLRAGYLSDSRLLLAVFNLGYDPLDTIKLYLEMSPKSITLLDKNGDEAHVCFEKQEDSIYSVCVKAEPMYPVILLIK